mmetsp:Transcript_28461/g.71665  ORF Transcript_28461/g.71665 Transcript_28461/m.71665 type:complete len:293 (-) Transcript_28461:1619-2497(-)
MGWPPTGTAQKRCSQSAELDWSFEPSFAQSILCNAAVSPLHEPACAKSSAFKISMDPSLLPTATKLPHGDHFTTRIGSSRRFTEARGSSESARSTSTDPLSSPTASRSPSGCQSSDAASSESVHEETGQRLAADQTRTVRSLAHEANLPASVGSVARPVRLPCPCACIHTCATPEARESSRMLPSEQPTSTETGLAPASARRVPRPARERTAGRSHPSCLSSRARESTCANEESHSAKMPWRSPVTNALPSRTATAYTGASCAPRSLVATSCPFHTSTSPDAHPVTACPSGV